MTQKQYERSIRTAIVLGEQIQLELSNGTWMNVVPDRNLSALSDRGYRISPEDRDVHLMNLISQANDLELELQSCLRRQDCEDLPEGAIEYLWDQERELREDILLLNRDINIMSRSE